MDYPCHIIQDLIPLYVEDACTPETGQEVRIHLSGCKECARVFCRSCDEAESREDFYLAAALENLRDWCAENLRKLLKGLLLLTMVFLLLCSGWWELTQVDRIPVNPEDYRVLRTLQMPDGDIYCEFQVPYASVFSHHYMLRENKAYFFGHRPVLEKAQMRQGGWRMDPDSVWDREAEQYCPVEAILLGDPENPENQLLIWERGMKLPLASEAEIAQIEAQDWTIY